MDTQDVIIIGAGAAGLMAANELGKAGLRVTLLEKNTRAGKKLLITGGGRCNVTNRIVTVDDFNSSLPRTVRHVLCHFTPLDAIRFFEKELQVPLILEEDGKYFTKSGLAEDVVNALVRAAATTNVNVRYQSEVISIEHSDGFFRVNVRDFIHECKVLLIATGGMSYPATGSDGWGYQTAKKMGHLILSPRPALTAMKTASTGWKELAGISVNCALTLWQQGRKLLTREGDLLFTHFGFSGPAVFDISRDWAEDRSVTARFVSQSENDILQFLNSSDKQIENRLNELLPSRLVLHLLALCGIKKGERAARLSGAERKALVEKLLCCEIAVSGLLGWGKAEVTAGGVDLRELKGASLESKVRPGVFFAGEILDVDGRVGGFNLHWAWASGVAAAEGIKKFLNQPKA